MVVIRATLPSKTRSSPMSSVSGSARAALLPGLALGLGRWRIHHLDALHLPDRASAERGHRLAERTDEVLAAIGDMGRPEQDPLERADRPDPDPRPARQRRRWGRHAPIRATTRRFLGARQR